MIVLTPAYAHALQHLCLARRPGSTLVRNFRLFAFKSNCRCPPNIRTATRHIGDDYGRWAIFSDGGTHTGDGETTAGWHAIARSSHGVCYVMFGPVITTAAHLLYAGASQHTNNTAELSGIVESLCFLSPIVLVPRGSPACLFMNLNMLLVFVLEPCNHEQMSAWDDGPAVAVAGSASHPCHILSHLQRWKEMREMNVRITQLLLQPSVFFFQAILSAHHGRPSFNTANLVSECNNLDEIQQCPCDARRQRTSATSSSWDKKRHAPCLFAP